MLVYQNRLKRNKKRLKELANQVASDDDVGVLDASDSSSLVQEDGVEEVDDKDISSLNEQIQSGFNFSNKKANATSQNSPLKHPFPQPLPK